MCTLVIGQFNEMVDGTYGIASSTAGSVYYVRVLSTLDREKLKPDFPWHRHSHSVVDVLPPESDSTVQLMLEKPKVSYKDIGGLDVQKQEMREAVELPLTQFELAARSGSIRRERAHVRAAWHWKAMMAKAVANRRQPPSSPSSVASSSRSTWARGRAWSATFSAS